MKDDKAGGGGDFPRAGSSFQRMGDRIIFDVELRPGETTIVSWKKLLRDAERAGGSTPSVPEPPANAHPNLESRFTAGQPTENEVKDASAAPHRFSAVIEKIERLYMGKHSSDEEDLNDLPDDDQYDTEDSFIDDAELDEYFEVDNSEIKHDGFFVNRGTLERASESTVSPNQQLKKRRRKDLPTLNREDGGDPIANKDAKLSKVAMGKTALQKSDAFSPSQSLGSNKEEFEDLGFKNASDIALRKKYTESGITLPDSSCIKVSNGRTSAGIKKIEKKRTAPLQSKNFGSKLKHASGPTEGLHQKQLDRSAYAQPKPHPVRLLNNVDGVEASIRVKEKNIREFPDNNVSKNPVQTTKNSLMHRKDGSSIKPKGSMLERAIRELERVVAETRPPSMENQEVDASSQAIKRRLPTVIKLKLERVARLAASHGKISEELLNRLMTILGHMIQLRTLKRNLKVMISMSASAKQEKDDMFQKIKNEVTGMIKLLAPTFESKASEQLAGMSDDFQEVGPEGKKVPKGKLSMNTAMEDKICDLYDLYVDGLDEDAGPQIRKLYAELADLWPRGFMDNHGIKRAICRAKERRKAQYIRQKEKVKKKMLTAKSEEGVRVEGSSAVQPQQMQERRSTNSSAHGVVLATRAVPSTSVQLPSPSRNGPNMDKLKESSSNSTAAEARVSEGGLAKKMVKRKPEVELDNIHARPEKLLHRQEEEGLKQAVDLPHKSNQQSTAPS